MGDRGAPGEADESDLPEVADLRAALRGLGVPEPDIEVRWDGSALAFWSGEVRGNGVNVVVDGMGSRRDRVRVLLDDFTFEEVRKRHLGAFLRAVFTGDARIVRTRLLWSRGLVLAVGIGSETYHADVIGDSPDDLGAWARPLLGPRG
ncbi:hypothetical protein AB0O01_31965 [Streptomyces sp. NPDC093252]|uniref:hypothetical protein n=1 Tax=Streptomyces sp. NPDC093252 TaxID=3154980 RepID=UPI00342B2B46